MVNLLIVILLFSASKQIKKTKLLMELYRHGSRSTFKNLLNESYFDDIGPSTLYANGMRQHLMLGRQISQDYHRTLRHANSAKYSMTFSSSETRCLQSAQAHNLGIYDLGVGSSITTDNIEALNPPMPIDIDQPTDQFSLSQGFLPLGIYSQMNRSQDTMFMPRMEACPQFDQSIKDMQASGKTAKLLKTIEPKVKEIFKKLDGFGYGCKKVMKKQECDAYDLIEYNDLFKSHFAHEGKWPENITKEFVFGQITPAASYPYLIEYSSNNLANPRIHIIAKKMLESMNEKKLDLKKDVEEFYKYIGFSGHETTLFPMLYVMNATSLDCVREIVLTGKTNRSLCLLIPDYASTITFDYAQGLGADYVKVAFNGQSLDFCPEDVDDGYCVYEKFVDLFMDRALEPNFLVRCKGVSKDNHHHSHFGYIITIAVLIFALATSMAFIWYLLGKAAGGIKDADDTMGITNMTNSIEDSENAEAMLNRRSEDGLD